MNWDRSSIRIFERPLLTQSSPSTIQNYVKINGGSLNGNRQGNSEQRTEGTGKRRAASDQVSQPNIKHQAL
jgi:hypothetical protein